MKIFCVIFTLLAWLPATAQEPANFETSKQERSESTKANSGDLKKREQIINVALLEMRFKNRVKDVQQQLGVAEQLLAEFHIKSSASSQLFYPIDLDQLKSRLESLLLEKEQLSAELSATPAQERSATAWTSTLREYILRSEAVLDQIAQECGYLVAKLQSYLSYEQKLLAMHQQIKQLRVRGLVRYPAVSELEKRFTAELQRWHRGAKDYEQSLAELTTDLDEAAHKAEETRLQLASICKPFKGVTFAATAKSRNSLSMKWLIFVIGYLSSLTFCLYRSRRIKAE